MQRALWSCLALAGCGFQIGASGTADAPRVDAVGDGATNDGAGDAMIDAPIDAMIDAAPPAACLTDGSYTLRAGTTHLYKLGGSLGWTDGRDACTAVGAHLVVIEDASENTYVDGLSPGAFWIGLSDSATEGSFVWVTGAALAGYMPWRTGQPNDDGGQDCGEMDPGSVGTWNDYTCPTAEPYVCECEP